MAQVKAVPDGYSTVTPFLNIDGAADAIEFYKKALGAEERSSPDGKPMRALTPDGKVMHAELRIGDSALMLSDAMMSPPTKSTMHLYVPDADALWARATAAGAEVLMPIGDMFWGDRYGVLGDKWGNRWAIATHKEDVPPSEMPKRMADAMKNRA
jgi:PhnB protein